MTTVYGEISDFEMLRDILRLRFNDCYYGRGELKLSQVKKRSCIFEFNFNFLFDFFGKILIINIFK